MPRRPGHLHTRSKHPNSRTLTSRYRLSRNPFDVSCNQAHAIVSILPTETPAKPNAAESALPQIEKEQKSSVYFHSQNPDALRTDKSPVTQAHYSSGAEISLLMAADSYSSALKILWF